MSNLHEVQTILRNELKALDAVKPVVDQPLVVRCCIYLREAGEKPCKPNLDLCIGLI